ncbi:MAG: sulfatase-like hydrolase/transferase, partial [Bacteroidota bacterium]
MKKIAYLIALILITSFTPQSGKNESINRPNILWITCEDMSPHLGSYGEKLAKTPVLDQLAKEGVRYTNAFSTAGVCAPSRAALITGCYQTAIGAQHMRTVSPSPVLSKEDYPAGYKPYSAVIPDNIKCFSEYLRKAGYYCTNNVKQDYQFEAPLTVWDENSSKAHWRNR